MLLEGQGHFTLEHAGADMLHKEVILLELGVPQLHLLLLEPLTHGQLSLDIFNGALLSVSKVHRVLVLFSLRIDRLVKEVSQAIQVVKLRLEGIDGRVIFS